MYTNVWDPTLPTGGEAANTIDDIDRSMKIDIQDRFSDIFAMPAFNTDPLRPYGLKFTDAQDSVINFGDNTGTPRNIIFKDKTGATTYATFGAAFNITGATFKVKAITDTNPLRGLVFERLADDSFFSHYYDAVNNQWTLTASFTSTGAVHPVVFNVGGAIALTIATNQNVTFGASVILPNTSTLSWTGRSEIQSPADGSLLLTNNAGTGFSFLMLGGTTNAFPAIARSGAGLALVLADNSAFCNVQAAAITATTVSGTTITASVGFVGPLAGNVTGNVSGSAATLNPGRNINGVAFNGSADITVTDARVVSGVRSSDISSSTASLISTGFTITVANGDSWMMRCVMWMSNAASATASFKVVTPSVTDGRLAVFGFDSNGVSRGVFGSALNNIQGGVSIGDASVNVAMYVLEISVRGLTAGGTVDVQFETGSAGNAVTILKDSYFTARRISP